MRLQRYIAIFLLLAFSVVFAPIDAVHHLFEEHNDELHHCHSEYCIRAYSAHCELCDFQSPTFYLIQKSEAVAKVLVFEQTPKTATPFFGLNDFLFPPNKAPPVS